MDKDKKIGPEHISDSSLGSKEQKINYGTLPPHTVLPKASEPEFGLADITIEGPNGEKHHFSGFSTDESFRIASLMEVEPVKFDTRDVLVKKIYWDPAEYHPAELNVKTGGLILKKVKE